MILNLQTAVEKTDGTMQGKITMVLQKRLIEDVDSALTGKDFTAVWFGHLDELSVRYKVYIY